MTSGKLAFKIRKLGFSVPQKTVVSLVSVVGVIIVTEKSRLIAVGIKLNSFRNCSGENGEINLE